MFIDIHELELHPVDFAEEFAPGVLDLGLDYSQRTPLKTTGRAELVPEHHGKHERLLDIRVHGDFSTTLEVACARCLEPVVTDVRNSYDLLYRPEGSDSDKEELSVTAAEAEISYYPGKGLELADVLLDVRRIARDCALPAGATGTWKPAIAQRRTKTPDGRDCKIFVSN